MPGAAIFTRMTKVEDIEKAVEQLSPQELARFRVWFEEFDARLFDERIERDAKAGKLDKLIAEVRANHDAGRREDPRFKPLYDALPERVRASADKSFALLKRDPCISSGSTTICGQCVSDRAIARSPSRAKTAFSGSGLAATRTMIA